MSATIVSHGRPFIVRINGRALHNWTSAEVGRDLANIAGVFRLELVEPFPFPEDYQPSVRVHDRIEIEIASETVLRGYVETVNARADAQSFHVTVSGRDMTGDMVDCAVNPVGPAEYRTIALETVVGHLASPFGISVETQVQTGAPFTLVALEPQDTALAAIERLTRQRGVLVTSDGLGKLLLTRAGTTRASDRLVWPGGNVQRMESQVSQRHSDTWVKGQFNSVLRGTTAALHVDQAPGQVASTGHTERERAASCRFGHSIDAGVPRYRPVVHLAKTQSGGSAETQNAGNPALDPEALGHEPQAPAHGAYHHRARRRQRQPRPPRTDSTPWTLQDQADWRMRTARAHATTYLYIVPGLKNAVGDVWKPNQIVSVRDTFNRIDGDMLIGAVTWVAASDHYETRISVVPPDAYDLTGDADRPSRSGHRSLSHNGRGGRG